MYINQDRAVCARGAVSSPLLESMAGVKASDSAVGH